MESTGKLVLGVSAALVLAIGGELLYLHHRNVVEENSTVPQRTAYTEGQALRGRHGLCAQATARLTQRRTRSYWHNHLGKRRRPT